MVNAASWDWDTREKIVAFADWKNQFKWVEEAVASPDGEKIAAIVNVAEGEFNVCVNGETWENAFDKIWYLRFAPDGRLTALVSDAGEWTVAVDGIPWENKFGYVWNTLFSEDGDHIAVAVQQDMAYCMAIDGVPWEESFSNMINPILGPDGRNTAAAVQVEDFGAGEIYKFQAGVYTAALNGKSWDTKFVNVWKMAVSPGGEKLAAEVRLNLYD
jgi:hypothetical protein